MNREPEYNRVFPHLIDTKRIELACDYLVHEFRKIFPDLSYQQAKMALDERIPTEESNNIAIRDFWNLFCAMTDGWRLKSLHIVVTAENVTWQKEKASIKNLVPATPQGWMTKVNPPNFANAVSYLRETDNELKKIIQTSREKRGNRAEGDENDPLIVFKDESILKVADGNSRLKLQIEEYVLNAANKKSTSIPKIDFWVGTPTGKPANYWIPTSSLTFMKNIIGFHTEQVLEKISQVALIEYRTRA